MMGKGMVHLRLEEAEVVVAGERKLWPDTCPRGKRMAVVVVVAVLIAIAALGHMVMMGLLALLVEVLGLA